MGGMMLPYSGTKQPDCLINQAVGYTHCLQLEQKTSLGREVGLASLRFVAFGTWVGVGATSAPRRAQAPLRTESQWGDGAKRGGVKIGTTRDARPSAYLTRIVAYLIVGCLVIAVNKD
ncbi:hypothetical protein LZ31DRAFT_220834 [Colletotrichum somersetense]|nr:hypothetical protein LZ31DRAFT_220834 [Colletotrichum somersetense]